MKSGFKIIAPETETITPFPVIDGLSVKGLFLPDTPHISEMSKAEYDKLYKEFDPCEYCPVYFRCSNPVKELEDVEPKHICPNTRRNFLRIYE